MAFLLFFFWTYLNAIFLKKDNIISKEIPPEISIILPVRNEEKHIEACLESLFCQSHKPKEIIVIDDGSTDKTFEIVSFLLKKNPILKLIKIDCFPAGWFGKNYANYLGAGKSSGQWLLFTDADTIHDPLALSTSLSFAVKNNLDALSLIPHFIMKPFERFILPAIFIFVSFLFPIPLVNKRNSSIALGYGPYIFIKRDVYFKIGGHENIKNKILDDFALINNIKNNGFTYYFAGGLELLSVKPFENLNGLVSSWAKVLYPLLKGNYIQIMGCFVFFFASLMPIFLIIDSFLLGSVLFLLLSILLYSLWVLLFASINYLIIRINPFYGLIYPVNIIILFALVTISIYKFYYGGINWKGRHYSIK